jgi:hypothetical protein
VAEQSKQVSETVLRHVVTRADGSVHDLGVVSYWSKNPLKMFRWKLVGEPAAKRRIRKFNASQPKEK